MDERLDLTFCQFQKIKRMNNRNLDLPCFRGHEVRHIVEEG